MDQTNYSVNSNITLVGSTVNSLVIRCSIVNNNISSATDIIDSFPFNTKTKLSKKKVLQPRDAPFLNVKVTQNFQRMSIIVPWESVIFHYGV